MTIARKADNNTVLFWCPGCDEAHGVDQRWTFNGDLDKPTFSPSLLLSYAGGYGPERINLVCHSFVRDGRIEFLTDSTHKLAGQTVDIPDWDKAVHE